LYQRSLLVQQLSSYLLFSPHACAVTLLNRHGTKSFLFKTLF